MLSSQDGQLVQVSSPAMRIHSQPSVANWVIFCIFLVAPPDWSVSSQLLKSYNRSSRPISVGWSLHEVVVMREDNQEQDPANWSLTPGQKIFLPGKTFAGQREASWAGAYIPDERRSRWSAVGQSTLLLPRHVPVSSAKSRYSQSNVSLLILSPQSWSPASCWAPQRPDTGGPWGRADSPARRWG